MVFSLRMVTGWFGWFWFGLLVLWVLFGVFGGIWFWFYKLVLFSGFHTLKFLFELSVMSSTFSVGRQHYAEIVISSCQ